MNLDIKMDWKSNILAWKRIIWTETVTCLTGNVRLGRKTNVLNWKHYPVLDWKIRFVTGKVKFWIENVRFGTEKVKFWTENVRFKLQK